MGRFISRDPIRYAGQDINLYRFVGNNPFGGLDPLGLREWDIKATIGVMLGLGFDIGYEEKIKDCPCKDAQSWFLKFTANAKAGAKAQIDYIVGSESVEGGSLTGGTSAFINVDCDGEASGGGCIEITGGVGYTATSSLFGFKEKNSVANVKETVSYCIKNRGDDIRFEISVCTSFDPYSVTPSVLGVSPGSIGLPKSKNCEVIFGGTFRKRQ